MVSEFENPRRAHVVVFSISAAPMAVAQACLAVADGRVVVLVTPHIVLENERQRIAQNTSAADWEFRPFHTLLNAADMEWCDTEADRQIASQPGSRSGRLRDYYARIRRLKNIKMRENLAASFELVGVTVLSGDLGIDADVWTEGGIDASPQVNVVGNREIILNQPSGSRLQRLKKFSIAASWMSEGGQRWLLLGKPGRVRQYLDPDRVKIEPISGIMARRIDLVLRLLGRRGGWRRSGVWLARWGLRAVMRETEGIATASHEHRDGMSLLAATMRVRYVNLQDSYLPSYYPSAYLRYREHLSAFWFWDEVSMGIGKRHAIPSACWSGFRRLVLPPLNASEFRAPQMLVYLASGAGDWTALKNRSDEDLAFLMLEEVARARPELTILFRPHPLWLHPEHQGMQSIERLVTYLQQSGPPNLMVSQGALRDGDGFAGSHNLSTVASTIDEDIAAADLVLGDHSQTLFVAAQRGKPIASLNPTSRPSFFMDHAALGFPLLRNAAELLAMVAAWSSPETRTEALTQYNAAIRAFNGQS